MYRKMLFSLAYLQKPVWDTGISPPELLEFIANHTPGRALDLGCGTATNAITLAKHGWEVMGVDFARIAILRAKRKARQNGVKVCLKAGDVTKIKENNGPFDLIIDIGCFPSLPPNLHQDYIDKIDHVLAEKGTFLTYLLFKIGSDDGIPGITEADIQMMTDKFHLVARVDGSERGIHPSAWITFQKKIVLIQNG